MSYDELTAYQLEGKRNGMWPFILLGIVTQTIVYNGALHTQDASEYSNSFWVEKYLIFYFLVSKIYDNGGKNDSLEVIWCRLEKSFGDKQFCFENHLKIF